MVTATQVLIAVAVGAGAAAAGYVLWHAARITLLDAFEALCIDIDDALAAPMPDPLDDEG